MKELSGAECEKHATSHQYLMVACGPRRVYPGDKRWFALRSDRDWLMRMRARLRAKPGIRPEALGEIPSVLLFLKGSKILEPTGQIRKQSSFSGTYCCNLP